ncbi:zinc ribbon-containing protein [Shewanella surugensis]|uniref:Zinc ribbon-containing protein n=1 Tax=Shewanella surugensis TaxID=212020 RepID=A0ABT0L8D9_9GAMM|nr:zinc ribbon-containing protein [Shewanella surugensis]MCL1123819.1 zinc ribbon-containing protein [Shewanella surugensis]
MSERSQELLKLYARLFEHVKIEYEFGNDMTIKKLYQEVSQGKEYLALKAQVKEDELALVEQFLKRDIASFLQEKNDADLSYSPFFIAAKNTFWHWLSEITDRSQLEWTELAQDFKHQGVYVSGEIIAQGCLACTACGHKMYIEFPDLIPDCPECDNDKFYREALAP